MLNSFLMNCLMEIPFQQTWKKYFVIIVKIFNAIFLVKSTFLKVQNNSTFSSYATDIPLLYVSLYSCEILNYTQKLYAEYTGIVINFLWIQVRETFLYVLRLDLLNACGPNSPWAWKDTSFDGLKKL